MTQRLAPPASDPDGQTSPLAWEFVSEVQRDHDGDERTGEFAVGPQGDAAATAEYFGALGRQLINATGGPVYDGHDQVGSAVLTTDGQSGSNNGARMSRRYYTAFGERVAELGEGGRPPPAWAATTFGYCGAWGYEGSAEWPDCNGNGRDDVLDISLGASHDCNANGVPDECENPDCNENGVLDSCDVSAATSPDCNTNGVPDECDVGFGTSGDCNTNLIPDECDIAPGNSEDLDEDGIPDECQGVGQQSMMMTQGGQGSATENQSQQASSGENDTDLDPQWQAMMDWLETQDFTGLKQWEISYRIHQKMAELGLSGE
ncbi:MAG: hypothetical protein U1A27_10110 [Phycisphaerae bacterium]